MTKREDLTGQVFGRLTVLELRFVDGQHGHWKCKCECGNIHTVISTSLKSGASTSCGCFHSLQMRRMAANRRKRRISATSLSFLGGDT